jgi:hypothetical protein
VKDCSERRLSEHKTFGGEFNFIQERKGERDQKANY